MATPQENIAAQFRAAGVPTFANQTEALTVVAQLTQHARLFGDRSAKHVESSQRHLPVGRSPFLDEAESLGFLSRPGHADRGISLCTTRRRRAPHIGLWLRGGGQGLLERASAQVGSWPRDLSMCATKPPQSRRTDFAEQLHAHGVEAGVIVAPMVASRREFVLGAKVDPLFGPVVMIGDGGRYVEALDDIALTLAPASTDDVREALFGLRIAPLLERLAANRRWTSTPCARWRCGSARSSPRSKIRSRRSI